MVFLAQFGPLHEMQDTASLDDSLVSAGFPPGFPPPFGGGSWGVGVGRCQVVWTERRHAPGLSSWQLGAENGSRKALGFKSVEELDASKVWAIAYVSDPRLIQPLKLHKKPDARRGGRSEPRLSCWPARWLSPRLPGLPAAASCAEWVC